MRRCTSVQIVLLVFLVIVTQSQARLGSTTTRRLIAKTTTRTVNIARNEAATTTVKTSTATKLTTAPTMAGGISFESVVLSSDTESDRSFDTGTLGISCNLSDVKRCDPGQVCWFEGDAAVGKCVAESSLASLNSAPSNQMAMLTFSIAVALLWACVLI